MRSWRKQGIYKSSKDLRLTIFQAIFRIMFHPGGFGDSNNRHPPNAKKAGALGLSGHLVYGWYADFWLISFIGGLKLGMGWYAWPLGTFILFLFFVGFNFWQFRKSDTN